MAIEWNVDGFDLSEWKFVFLLVNGKMCVVGDFKDTNPHETSGSTQGDGNEPFLFVHALDKDVAWKGKFSFRQADRSYTKGRFLLSSAREGKG